jgi:hypothetical protein
MVGTLLDTSRQIVVGAVRIVAWDSLKEGLIDLRPLSPTARLLAVLGLVLIGFFLAGIVFSDPLRFSGTLEPVAAGSDWTRGLYAPSPAIPLTLISYALAWALLLTGALRVHGLARWGILAAFVLFGLQGLVDPSLRAIVASEQGSGWLVLGLQAAALVLLVGGFVVLPRRHLPLWADFVFALLVVAIFVGVNLYVSVQAQLASGIAWVSDYTVPGTILGARILTVPFVFISAYGMANFAIAASSWAAQSAQRATASWVVTVLLVALIVARLADISLGAFLPAPQPEQLWSWAGAALTAAGLVPIARWRQGQEAGKVPPRLLNTLIVGLLLVPLMLTVAITVAAFLIAATAPPADTLARTNQFFDAVRAAGESYQGSFSLVVALSALGIALAAAARKRFTVAAFGFILAWTRAVWWFMEPGRPLEIMRYRYEDMDAVLTLGLALITLYYLARRRLTPERGVRLFGLVFLAWILRQTDFIDNPLAIFFSLAGISYLVFGILWGVLTAGGQFANASTPQFPRTNRLLLYVGYVLMTVLIAHWFLVTNHVFMRVLQSDWGITGFTIFGLALAYLVFVEGGRALLKRSEAESAERPA